MTDLDWCIKVYDTVDHISTPEDAQDQPNLKATWSKIDDRMPTVFKRLIPIRFVGAAPADSESDKSVPLAGMMTMTLLFFACLSLGLHSRCSPRLQALTGVEYL